MVIQYLTDKYGMEKAAHTLELSLVIKPSISQQEVAKELGVPQGSK